MRSARILSPLLVTPSSLLLGVVVESTCDFSVSGVALLLLDTERRRRRLGLQRLRWLWSRRQCARLGMNEHKRAGVFAAAALGIVSGALDAALLIVCGTWPTCAACEHVSSAIARQLKGMLLQIATYSRRRKVLTLLIRQRLGDTFL